MSAHLMPVSLELTLSEAHEHLSRAAELLAYAVTGPTCPGETRCAGCAQCSGGAE